MRIALCTRSFRPEIGGLGSVTHDYAQGLMEQGSEPLVLTSTAAPQGYDEQFPYRVFRQPGFREFRRLARGCDCIVFMHQSLVYILWSLFIGKPVVSSIHGRIWNWTTPLNALLSIIFELHLRLRRNAVLISESVRSPSTRHAPVIGNPYDGEVFHAPLTPHSPGTVIFSGRINRDKGIFHLVAAMRILRERSLGLRFTFLGSGPGERDLREAINAAGLVECTRFIGHSEPRRVAELLGEHQTAAIPSNWNEPFGIVALEAIACGCYVVAFPDGGLPLAVGDAGLVTKDKSPEALADGIQRVLTDETLRRHIDEKRSEHLEKFSRRNIVAKLLNAIKSACGHAIPISK